MEKHPGRELRVEAQNQVIRARCYAVVRRIYLMIFSTTKVANQSVAKFDETFAKAFFDSFKLTGVDTTQDARLQEKPNSLAQAEPQQVPSTFLTGNTIRKVAPLYPSDAKSSRISGVVMVRVFISDKGKVIRSEAVSGPQQLRAAAAEAAKQWVFRPLRIGGVPVNTMGLLTFNFNLQ